MLTIFMIALSLLILVGLFSKPKRPERKHTYDSDYGDPESLLSPWNKGFSITGTEQLTMKTSMEHAGVCAPSGAGKTTVAAMCTLLRQTKNSRTSLIIFDPSKQLHPLSAGWLASQGYDIVVEDFSDSSCSAPFNPLHGLRNGADMNKVSGVLIDNALGQGKDVFWNQSSKELINLLIRLVLLEGLGKQYGNLPNVKSLLRALASNAKFLDRIVARHADSETYAMYKSFLSSDVKIRQGVISTALAALQFLDQDIANILATEGPEFSTLRKTKKAIYIQTRITEFGYYKPLVELYLGQMFAALMHELPTEDDLSIMVILDEFGSIKIPNMASIISNCRKYKIALLYCYQSLDQLHQQYGKFDATTIQQNTYAKVIYGGMDAQQADTIQQLGGKFSFKDETGKDKTRELITSSEARMLPKGKAFLVAGNLPVMQITLTPFYEQYFLKRRSAIPAPELVRQTPETVPLLDNDPRFQEHAKTHAHL